MKKFYITTAIPFVNATPHLGHVLEYVQTDVIARYHRLLNEDVFFLTGTDENSLKNVQAAEKKGISTQELCDKNTAVFIEVCKKYNISYNNFIRTSNKEKHFPGVKKLWELSYKNEDIYKKKYRGLYCVGCECFYKEDELEKHGEEYFCPEHKKPVEIIEEENYFFKLSKYENQLIELIGNDIYKIIPESRKNEVISFIQSGLEDFSVSRSKERAHGWGIPVPDDENQIMYVWYDALSNYLTGIGYPDEKYKNWWPADIHAIGKGITRFHAVYWPAMLLSAGIELPKNLFIHGYITIEGEKMSKSLGNIKDPLEIIDKYEIDSVRYYLLSGIPTFLDGDFSEIKLIEINNNELVANFGNLVNRTMVFANRYFESKIPGFELNEKDKEFIEKQKLIYKEIENLLNENNIRDSLDKIMLVSKNSNQYFQENEPWKLNKENKERCGTVIYVLLNQVKDLAILINPFLPNASEKIFKQLNTENKKWDNLGELSLEKNSKLNEAEILFKKIEEIKEIKEEIQEIDLEVAQIIEIKKHPEAEKLYIEKLKTSEGEKTIVSGLAPYYSKEELINKKIIWFKNLKPAKLRGIISEGMLLAGGDKEGKIEVIDCKDFEIGDKILIQGIKQEYKKEIDFKEFQKIKFNIENNNLFINGKQLFIENKPIKTEKIKEGKVS
ncbi:MAG: methionine--tRNA ligase [Candidatus Micrarchaeia archaeon]|jgi:methionyl-tRNA synthetase